VNKRLFFILPVLFLSFTEWHHDLADAEQIAKKEHKHILLNFSGSDWCGPCIRMRREIFGTQAFQRMADTDLVLVNADFPRMKKNRPSAAPLQLNEAMADQYNPRGKFPFTLLLTAGGTVLKEWDGFPDTDPAGFAQQVKAMIDADK
jgi:hypothetical protein